jgi:hypothetical protein
MPYQKKDLIPLRMSLRSIDPLPSALLVGYLDNYLIGSLIRVSFQLQVRQEFRPSG